MAETTYRTGHDVSIVVDESQPAEVEASAAAAAKTLHELAGSVQQPAAASTIRDPLAWQGGGTCPLLPLGKSNSNARF